VTKAVAIDPDGLIQAARHLVDHNPTGRPRNALLRRAVSSAYYALFHEISRQAAQQMTPGAVPAAQYTLARFFSHAQITLACSWIAQRGSKAPPAKLKPVVETLRNSSLVPVAEAFYDLRKAREAADYDHLHKDIAKETVIATIDDAEAAIAHFRSVSADRTAFLGLLAVCALGKGAPDSDSDSEHS
jgi:uncharacterized protein (UPF0332 family)